jgi:anti-anti-sigma regulatory factor
MFKVKFDQPKNWLTIIYSGYVDPGETDRCAEEIRVALAMTKPGFRLLVDMTDLQGMEVSCAPHIRNLMEMCNQNGVAKVVRIIPNPKLDIGFQIMSYFHYRDDVHIVTCETVDEAMNLLAQ